jgi:hypothetical protein
MTYEVMSVHAPARSISTVIGAPLLASPVAGTGAAHPPYWRRQPATRAATPLATGYPTSVKVTQHSMFTAEPNVTRTRRNLLTGTIGRSSGMNCW